MSHYQIKFLSCNFLCLLCRDLYELSVEMSVEMPFEIRTLESPTHVITTKVVSITRKKLNSNIILFIYFELAEIFWTKLDFIAYVFLRDKSLYIGCSWHFRRNACVFLCRGYSKLILIDWNLYHWFLCPANSHQSSSVDGTWSASRWWFPTSDWSSGDSRTPDVGWTARQQARQSGQW